MLAPLVTTPLQVGFRLATRGFAVGAQQGILQGGLMGGTRAGTLKAIIATVIGGVVFDSLLDMFQSENAAHSAEVIIDALEEATDAGAVLVPEQPRGYDGTVYAQRLNYWHVNGNDGKIWKTDFPWGNRRGRR